MPHDEQKKISATRREFFVSPIDEEIRKKITGKSYKEDCPVPLCDLRYVKVLHKDSEGVSHEGELVCNAYIAAALIDIFQKLYAAAYPIEKIRLIDEYAADDETSMRDNNSSCFNFRFISRTKKISKHGLGLAVDINPLYNPYVKLVDGETVVAPSTALPYTNRKANFPYKTEENSLCCRLFEAHGFVWGGAWTNRKDYQHFELPDDLIAALYPDLGVNP